MRLIGLLTNEHNTEQLGEESITCETGFCLKDVSSLRNQSLTERNSKEHPVVLGSKGGQRNCILE